MGVAKEMEGESQEALKYYYAAAASQSDAAALVSLNPFQGTGPNATLTLVYSHPSGWAAIYASMLN